jgi:hypothetical protein
VAAPAAALPPRLRPQFFHGEHEVFRSDHSDVVEASTVESKCRVLSLDEYLVSVGVWGR